MMSLDSLKAAKALYPWSASFQVFCDDLTQVDCRLAETARSLDRPVFGAGSDFFYLPIAQAIDWGIDDKVFLSAIGPLFAAGHVYYSLHDDLIDEGHLEYEEAALMDASLHIYLNRLLDIQVASIREHIRYSQIYTKALLRELDAWQDYLDNGWALRCGEKSAPVLTALYLVAERAVRLEELQVISQATLWMTNGIQLLDDLTDMETDQGSRGMTFPKALGLREAAELRAQPSGARGATSKTNDLASYCLQRSRELFSTTTADMMKESVEQLIRRSGDKHSDVK